ncbi:hypothetical protein HPP92_026381 [Vanilla planifolia]|uniref:RRM domain-containing protein n=1 Tax=Vanilla planifolia TaxID=51239 RepID=A0A835PJ09_VANPL|nr:hypothetical protein HPP92_026381 [Vanilla planifolia]
MRFGRVVVVLRFPNSILGNPSASIRIRLSWFHFLIFCERQTIVRSFPGRDKKSLNHLDMTLDGLINNRSSRGRGGGLGRDRRHGWVKGRGITFGGRAVGMLHQRPLRVNNRSSSFKIAKSFSKAKDLLWRHDLFEESVAAARHTGVENGTKLYISNLDYGVSNEDIKELFSEVGDLKKCTVHYDRSGRPSGSAEVVYARRSDAVAAVKRYNNVQLDGKPMKIEIIGSDLGLPVAPRVNVVGGGNGRGKRTVVMTPGFGQGAAGSFKQASRHGPGGALRGRGRISRGGSLGGRGRGGRGGKQPVKKTAEDLDKELEKYHADAMSM